MFQRISHIETCVISLLCVVPQFLAFLCITIPSFLVYQNSLFLVYHTLLLFWRVTIHLLSASALQGNKAIILSLGYSHACLRRYSAACDVFVSQFEI